MWHSYNKLMERLHERGIKVTKHILNNKASGEYLKAIKHNGVIYEKIPSNIHCRNVAEKASGTFKDNFQAIIAEVDQTFPIHLWDRHLPPCYGQPTLHQGYQHMHIWTDNMTSRRRYCHPWGVQSCRTTNWTTGNYGMCMQARVFTSKHQESITSVTEYG